jgi:cyclophilin family peptidyl-prolyl cis-trans isomerase
MKHALDRSNRLSSIGACVHARVAALAALAALCPLPAAHAQTNTIARFHTDFGTFDVELFDQVGPNGLAQNAAPRTVENFLDYICTKRYDGTFIHRSAPGFVIQGGGFSYVDPRVRPVRTFGPIANEFSLERSNVMGTIAMAKVAGNPNSATSHFFFNLVDNSARLNTQNGGFTVFGRVIAGWSVVEGIAGLTIVDYSAVHGALATVPVMPNYTAGDPISNDVLVNIIVESIAGQRICLTCDADCDESTGFGVLDIFDFLCFQDRFVNAEPYACDCDTTTGPGVCDMADFLCFQSAFVAGCP